MFLNLSKILMKPFCLKELQKNLAEKDELIQLHKNAIKLRDKKLLNWKINLWVKLKNKKELQIICNSLIFKWSHLGSNQGPSDYESDALTG